MVTAIQNIKQLHLEEWVNGSGVSKVIAELNLVSIDNPNEIAKLLGWKSYHHTPGWYVAGVDLVTGQHRKHGQFKPDCAIQFPDDDKPQKYFTFPKGIESEVIYLAVDRSTWERISSQHGVPINPEDIDNARADLGFWRWVLNHPEITIILTEGVKKAACLLSKGYVAIALTGVWNGQRKKKLIPSLKDFIVVSRPIDLVFDADVVVKNSVQDALRFLGHLIHKAKGIVRIVTWNLEMGKGCDDFIVAHGAEKFEQVIDEGLHYSEWLKKLKGQFQSQQKKQEDKGNSQRPDLPETIIIATELVEKYRTKLAWNDDAKSWYRYEAEIPGVWSKESDIAIEGVVGAELDTDPRTSQQYSYSYLTNIIKLMRPRLLVKHWDAFNGLGIIPLTDGVLHLKTMELRAHAPGHRLTWALPYSWGDRGIGCKPIINWLLETMQGDRDLAELLRAYLNAVVTGRVDLQHFLKVCHSASDPVNAPFCRKMARPSSGVSPLRESEAQARRPVVRTTLSSSSINAISRGFSRLVSKQQL